VFYSRYGLFVLGVGKKTKLISGKKKTHWVHKLRKTFGLVTRCLAENLEHRIRTSTGEDQQTNLMGFRLILVLVMLYDIADLRQQVRKG